MRARDKERERERERKRDTERDTYEQRNKQKKIKIKYNFEMILGSRKIIPNLQLLALLRIPRRRRIPIPLSPEKRNRNRKIEFVRKTGFEHNVECKERKSEIRTKFNLDEMRQRFGQTFGRKKNKICFSVSRRARSDC